MYILLLAFPYCIAIRSTLLAMSPNVLLSPRILFTKLISSIMHADGNGIDSAGATLLSICLAVVVDFLFIVTPIVGVCNCSMFCCTLLYVHFSIAIILMGKRELIALLNLSSWCLVMVERLFLAVPRGCLQFVIVVFPDHTHLLFLL